jgi:hypothetical protein
MNFKDLTDKDKKNVKKIYLNKDLTWDERMKNLMEYFGKSERTARKWLVALGIKQKVDKEPSILTIAKTKKHDGKKKYFLITWAQNATPVNLNFFNNIKKYSEFLNGQVLVIPGRYHNPTSMWTNNDESQEWWDESLLPYLSLNRHNLNKSISVLSDIKIQPTATNPLTSLECLTANQSSIVGHPRVHLKSMPVMDANKPKIIMSTGGCTKPNFTDSKNGAISSFHYTYGFVIVEVVDDELFYARQVTALEDGSFCDLYYSVKNEKVERIKEVAALIKGDIHYGNHDEKVLDISFNKLIPKINPKQIVLHDIFDGYSINHHEANNFIKQYHNEVNGTNSLKREIDNLISWLDKIKKYNLVIVFSNHDDFLNRFIINSDIRKNVKNALEYVEYAKVLLENNAPNGLIAYIINKNIPQIKCLGRNESYKIKDFFVSIHGMDGVNGSKGSLQAYRKMNTKTITAHAHSIGRLDGAIQVGCNTKLRMGYNNGVSSWVHSDVIIHENGKVQHIIYIGEEKDYTTFK